MFRLRRLGGTFQELVTGYAYSSDSVLWTNRLRSSINNVGMGDTLNFFHDKYRAKVSRYSILLSIDTIRGTGSGCILVPGTQPHRNDKLPDIPYFKGAPVFQPHSPASRNEATRDWPGPVFQLGPVNHQSPHTVTHFMGHALSP